MHSRTDIASMARPDLRATMTTTTFLAQHAVDGPERPRNARRRRRSALRAATARAVAVVVTSLVVMMLVVVARVAPAEAVSAPIDGRLTAPVTHVLTSPDPTADPSRPGAVVPAGLDESDPFLTVAQGRYFLYTSGVPGLPPINVPEASSLDFGSWTSVGDALPTLPAWATPGYTWAPDVHRFGSTYVLYFTAMTRGSFPATECIGDATSPSPSGPFTAVPSPFICQRSLGGSIDPRVFTDQRGISWMLWKSDQNIGGASTPTQMWSERLNTTGLTLVGRPSLLLGPDQPWQGTVVEAPDMVEVDGGYWLLFSGNWFNQPAYAIGSARCAGPNGPCADTSSLPFLASNDQGQGPGEESLLADGNGVWMTYSPSYSQAAQPYFPSRLVLITRLGFTPAGPYLASGETPPSLAVLDPRSLFPPVPGADTDVSGGTTVSENETADQPRRLRNSAETALPSAWLPVTFITRPTKNPVSLSSPSQ
jgi:hypothetical protein